MTGLPSRQIDFELLGIGTVLKRNRLIVPLNQREYSWGHRHVEELFQDLTDAIASNKQAYFLGAIVLTLGTNGDLEIADGQQRLATTTILLAAIRDYYYHKADNDMVRDLNDFLYTFDRETREDNPRLSLNVTDHEFFFQRVLREPNDNLREAVSPTKPSHELLDHAAIFAEQHVQSILSPLSESAKTEHLNRWLGFIEDSAQVITLKVSDDMNAYVMFETLNDRGLRVSQTDLVKNYLFQESGTRTTEAQDRWSSMHGSLEGLDDDGATIAFLRHLLISIHGPVRERDVLERVRQHVRGRGRAIDFLDILSSAAGDYVDLQTPTSVKWSTNSIRMGRLIRDLTLLRVTPLRPLILAVVRHYDMEQIEQAFRRFISWSARWLIAGGARSGGVETAIGLAAKAVTSGEIGSVDALSDKLAAVVPNNSSFELSFRTFTVANHRLARYYLRSLEVACVDDSEPEWIPNDDTVITLEHILPQRPGANWPGIEAAIHTTYFKRLGNVGLLAQTPNSSVGNAPFEDKKTVFAASEYQLTREISTEDVWGPAEIEERQDRLSKLAVTAWPLE